LNPLGYKVTILDLICIEEPDKWLKQEAIENMRTKRRRNTERKLEPFLATKRSQDQKP
jgi:hypothetical protein